MPSRRFSSAPLRRRWRARSAPGEHGPDFNPPAAVRRERALERVPPCCGHRECLQRSGVAAVAERIPGAGQHAVAEEAALAAQRASPLRPLRAPGRRARSARPGRAPRRRRPSPRCARGRGRRGSRRAGAPCRGPPARTAAAGRSGGGSPRRSSRCRARSAPRRAGRRRARAPALGAGRSASSQSGLSPRGRRPRSRPRGHSAQDVGNGLDRPVDLLVAVGEGDEHRLELRRRDVDAPLEQAAEERPVTPPCRQPPRPSKSRTGLSPQNSVSIAPTRWTRPYGARSPSSSRAARARARRRRPASRSRRSTDSPAAVASGFPESVPAWYTSPAGASRSIELGAAAERRERQPAADDLARGSSGRA